jgi:hypothetical protein
VGTAGVRKICDVLGSAQAADVLLEDDEPVLDVDEEPEVEPDDGLLSDLLSEPPLLLAAAGALLVDELRLSVR